MRLTGFNKKLMNSKKNQLFKRERILFNIRNEMNCLCHKLKNFYSYIFATWCCKPLIFQNWIIWSNRILVWNVLWFTTLSCKDIGTGKSEFVAKTEFLCFELSCLVPWVFQQCRWREPGRWCTWWLRDR